MDPMVSSRKQEDPLIAALRDARLWDEVELRTSGGVQASAERRMVETVDESAPGPGLMNPGMPDPLA